MKSKKFNFEEDYFEGYYKGIADFTDKRDRQLINWFWGIFDCINRYYAIKSGNGKSLIEFGCATGAASSVLKKFGWNVTATDISNYAVTKARKNFKGVKFLTHDMEKKFKKQKFDAAIALDVIEHLYHPEQGIKNVYELLKTGGVAIFLTPNDYVHNYNDPTHVSVKKPYEWLRILKKTGFKKIFVKQVALVPFIYRWYRCFAFAFPFAINFKYVISPVILIARK